MSYAKDVRAKIENANEMSRIKADYERSGYGMKKGVIFVVRFSDVEKHENYYKMTTEVFMSGDVVDGVLTFRLLAGGDMGFNGSDSVIDMIEATLEKVDPEIEYRGLMYRAEIEDFERGLETQRAIDDAAEDRWDEDDEDDEVKEDDDRDDSINVNIHIY